FEQRKTILEREVEELRGLERDYRSRLRSFIEDQLQDLDSQARVTDETWVSKQLPHSSCRGPMVGYFTYIAGHQCVRHQKARPKEPMWSIPANRSYNGLGGSHCSPWSWLTLLIYGQKKQCLPQWSRVRAEPSLSLCCTGALSETRVLLFLLVL